MLPSTDRALHHALCVTDDEDGVGATLAAVLGLPPGASDLSWEEGSVALIGTLLGPASSGAIELTPLPDQLRGHLNPGTTSISFGVDDLEARVAACRAAGLDVTVAVGGGALSYAVVTVAGLEFELVGC